MSLLSDNRLFDGNYNDTETKSNLRDIEDYRNTPSSQSIKYKKEDEDSITLSSALDNPIYEKWLHTFASKGYNIDKEEGENVSNTNWEEKYLDSLDKNMREIKQGFTDTENRISEMVNKQIEHSNHLDKQRHEENQNLNKKIDNSVNAITSELRATNKWIIGLVITTIIGIVGIVIAALTAIL